jgi:large subunit ribosomal protein L22
VEVKSVAKNTGIPASKMRRLVDIVRGKPVDEALTLLKFAPSPSSRIVAKVVKAAATDAENVYRIPSAELRIVKIFADEAQTLKRYRAGARRRVKPILKRSSHITVIVGEQEA